MGINLNFGDVNGNIKNTQNLMNSSVEGRKYKTECEEALKQWDYFNDGVTSKGEFTVHNSSITFAVFSGNEELLGKANEITDAQNALYEAYAGDDGILSAEEYDACLQSEENGALLDGWHDLNNQNAALKGDIDDIHVSRYDENGDGKTSAKEIYKSRLENAKKLYGVNSEEYKQIKADAKKEYKLLKKGAANNGNITSEDYASARQIIDLSKKSSFFTKFFGLK